MSVRGVEVGASVWAFLRAFSIKYTLRLIRFVERRHISKHERRGRNIWAECVGQEENGDDKDTDDDGDEALQPSLSSPTMMIK